MPLKNLTLKDLITRAGSVIGANRIRKSRLAITVGLLVLALPLCAAGFLAPSILIDGFENNPADRWVLQHQGNGLGGFDLNVGTAHSGLNDAWLISVTG